VLPSPHGVADDHDAAAIKAAALHGRSPGRDSPNQSGTGPGMHTRTSTHRRC
jgi:hypothetical protein